MTTNFKQSNLSDCIAKVNNSQSAIFRDFDINGPIKIGIIKQSLASSLVGDCVQKAEIGQNIVKDIISSVGAEVVSVNKTATKTDIKSKVDSSQESTGLIGDAGRFVSGVIESATGFIIGPVIGFVIIVIIFLIVGGILVYKFGPGLLDVFKGNKGESTKPALPRSTTPSAPPVIPLRPQLPKLIPQVKTSGETSGEVEVAGDDDEPVEEVKGEQSGGYLNLLDQLIQSLTS